jgi:predicted GIY-YIG superfamily endonuclease
MTKPPKPKGRPSKYENGLTLREAKRLEGAFVYGLADEGGIFYIGQTRSARRRFQAHAEARTNNPILRERIKATGDTLRVLILHENPDDLSATEREEIRRRGADLVNLVGADHFAWSKRSDLPWGAGTGVHAPTAYAMMRVRPHVRAELRERLAGMTNAERCLYEVQLLASWPDPLQRKFDRWLSITRDKMIACLEEEHGAA